MARKAQRSTSRPAPSRGGRLGARLKKYFLTGFLVLVPLGATFSLLRYVIGRMDAILEPHEGRFLFLIPERFHPDQLVGHHLPGLGVLFTVILIVLVGLVTTNYLGKRLLEWNDRLIDKIPFVRGFYGAVKTFMDTVFTDKGQAFRKVVLVDWFQKGQYALGFVTGPAANELQARTRETVINVFVPTTPNPTSGFFIMVPEKQVVPLSMSVEDAFKVIMSGGILTPDLPEEVARRLKNGTLEIAGGERK